MNESPGWSGLRKDLTGRLDPLTGVALVVIVLAALQLTAGALQVGITIDEPMHTYRTQTLLDSGWYVPGHLLEDGKPSSDPIATPFVYGPGFSMPAHLAARILGIEDAGLVSEEKGAWAFRHLMLTMIALLTTFSVGLCVRSLTGSGRAAIWSAAALLCIPVWTGMGMFNVKDLPVAAGYTLITTGLVISLAAADPLAKRTFRAVVALCAVGLLLSFGVRFAMWVPLTASLSVWLVLLLARHKWRDQPIRSSLLAVGLGLTIGLVLVVVFYPAVFGNPIELLVSSVRASSDYQWGGLTLTAGSELRSAALPFWYLPAWTFAVLPLMIGSAAVVGLISWLGAVISSILASKLTAFISGGKAPLALVVVQVALLPLAAILVGSTMYDGIRQHLYVVPAVAILAGYGFALLWRLQWFASTSQTWRRTLLVVLAGAALIVPFFEQSRLFPYNYTYINPVAGIGGVNGRWEADFWSASRREAVEGVGPGATVACPADLSGGRFMNCGRNWVLRFMPEGVVPFDPADPPKDPVVIITGLRGRPEPVPAYCSLERTVTRRLRFEKVAMSRVLLCDAEEVATGFSEAY